MYERLFEEVYREGMLLNCFKHLRTVLTHKWHVFVECSKAGIPLQGILHDMSKFSPTEFFTSAKYYQGDKSPIPMERKDKGGRSDVWLHHKSHNKHHWDYWTDFSHGKLVLVEMPEKYVLEMACDMIGASRSYGGSTNDGALQYLERNWDSFMMNEKSKELLKKYLTSYAETGHIDVNITK